MPIRITEYTEAMVDSVMRFNDRIRAGGVESLFPTSPRPAWLPKLPGRQIFQEQYLALDDQAAVRGAYILQHRQVSLQGQTIAWGDFQLPISEGSVDRRYVAVGPQLLLDALKRQPLLIAMGMGGFQEALPQLLRAAGWNLFAVPFFFRVTHPFPFLRNIRYLRRGPLGRTLLDALAFSGLGWLTVKTVHAARGHRIQPDPAVTVAEVDEFHEATDELWNAHRGQYGVSPYRDHATLKILYPKDERKFIRLEFSRRQQLIGWAVLLNSPLAGHNYFGNVRLGSIVDCFAPPAEAGQVIRCARDFLEAQGVDLIVSNQAHAAWGKALQGGGFLRGPSNFLFASSPDLTRLFQSRGIGSDDLHVNRGDGDGPINL